MEEAGKRQSQSSNQKSPPPPPVYDIRKDLEGRYVIRETIGSGAYGTVWSATSLKTSTNLAVKRIRNRKDTLYCIKRTLREIKILRHFKHDNIVCLHDVVMSENEHSLYLIVDLLECDLHKIIQSPQVLTMDHVRWFLYQLLCALKYLHSANVVHRDIKPSNLLVNSNCLLKLADFGMARCLNDPTSPAMLPSTPDPGGAAANGVLNMTIYVATRWYRCPELILCHSEYTTSIDMWSVGCILGEMINRRPLFPGKSQVHQLTLIISLLGNPNSEFVGKIKSDSIRKYVNNLPRNGKKSNFYEKFSSCKSREALDLLQRLLIWEPTERLEAELALSHSFFKIHHNPAEEPICCKNFDYSFENSLMTMKQLSSAISDEISQIQAKKTKTKFDLRKVENASDNPLAGYYKALLSKRFPAPVAKAADKLHNEEPPPKKDEEPKDDAMMKKEQSQAVKQKLREAILSESWRKPPKPKTRSGRSRNSPKVTKKSPKVTEAGKKSAQAIPLLSKEDLGKLTHVKEGGSPITVKILTKSDSKAGSKAKVVTLSFCSPKPKSKKAEAGMKIIRGKQTASANKVLAINSTSATSTISTQTSAKSANTPPSDSSSSSAHTPQTYHASTLVSSSQALPSINEVYPPCSQIIMNRPLSRSSPGATNAYTDPALFNGLILGETLPDNSLAVTTGNMSNPIQSDACFVSSNHVNDYNTGVSTNQNPGDLTNGVGLQSFGQMEDTVMKSAASSASSAATIPFQDEMDELTYKLSSSSIHNSVFPDFLAGLDDERVQLMSPLSDNPGSVSTSDSSTVGGVAAGGGALDDDLPDCQSAFNITSAEMIEIEDEIKRDFCNLDCLSLLELD